MSRSKPLFRLRKQILHFSSGSLKARDRRAITRAPVMWSHSCAKHYNNITRNVPDSVLDKIGRRKGKVDGVVMVK